MTQWKKEPCVDHYTAKNKSIDSERHVKWSLNKEVNSFVVELFAINQDTSCNQQSSRFQRIAQFLRLNSIFQSCLSWNVTLWRRLSVWTIVFHKDYAVHYSQIVYVTSTHSVVHVDLIVEWLWSIVEHQDPKSDAHSEATKRLEVQDAQDLIVGNSICVAVAVQWTMVQNYAIQKERNSSKCAVPHVKIHHAKNE